MAVVEPTLTTTEIKHELGEVEALKVILKLGIIRTRVEATSSSRYAVLGEYRTDTGIRLDVDYVVEGKTGILTITQPSVRFGFSLDTSRFEGRYRLELELTNAVPIDLEVRVGVGETVLDLSDLHIRSLTVRGGVGRTAITLPGRGSPDVSIRGDVGEIVIEPPDDVTELSLRSLSVKGGVGSLTASLPHRGSYDVSVEAGVGEVTVEVPDDLGARVRFERPSFISKLCVSNARLNKVGTSEWQTPGYTEAAHRADVRIQAGIGRVNVVD